MDVGYSRSACHSRCNILPGAFAVVPQYINLASIVIRPLQNFQSNKALGCFWQSSTVVYNMVVVIMRTLGLIRFHVSLCFSWVVNKPSLSHPICFCNLSLHYSFFLSFHFTPWLWRISLLSVLSESTWSGLCYLRISASPLFDAAE